MSLTFASAPNHGHPIHHGVATPNAPRHALAGAVIAVASVLVFIAPTLAQGTLRFAWQASLDNGTTWTGDHVEVANPNAEVLVRARIDWQNSPGYAFAGGSFDATITGIQGAGLSDEVLNIGRAAPLNQNPQMLTAFRFGEVIKIDDARDDRPPGVGSFFIQCSQVMEIGGWPFSRENPITLFNFTLRLDGTPGSRIINHRFPETAGGAIMTPRLYTNSQGGQTTPVTISLPLEIAVIPAPSAALLAAAGPLFLAYRCRRSRELGR